VDARPVNSPSPQYTIPGGAPASVAAPHPGPQRTHPAVRAIVTVLVILLLIATPIVSGYVAYKLTLHQPLW
jgi:hypothetical protein